LAKAGDFEQAKELHNIAVDLKGNPEEAYLNLGIIYKAEGKLYAAKKALMEALAIYPQYDEAEEALQDVNEAILLEKQIYELRLRNNSDNN
jgi:Flp pilus assembly protein TadD